MPCFHPLAAWQTESGDVVFVERGKIRRSLTLPCYQCVGCRLERSRQWAVRCMHEAAMHEFNSFVTLTYDDENLPNDSSLNYRHFQLFIKRVRRKFDARVRFYMCGEYGETTSRPHYHACIFGLRPADLYRWRTSSAGFQRYRSESLERLWSRGSVEVGDVSFESAAYVARYIMKKVTGKDAERHYEICDPYTGEIHNRIPEFTRMSLKPGIGANWYKAYKAEVFPLDRVVVRGVECKPPRYYFNMLKSDPSDLSDSVEYSRYLKSLKLGDDNTPERLAVKEAVTLARVSTLKRSVE